MRRATAPLLIGVLLLTGCSSPQPDPTATAIPTVAPTTTSTLSATPTPIPSPDADGLSDDELIALCVELSIPYLVGHTGPTEWLTIHYEEAIVGTPQRDGYQPIYVPATNDDPSLAVHEASTPCVLHADPSMERLAYGGSARFTDEELRQFLNGEGRFWDDGP